MTISQSTYNRDHLPSTYLTPPFPAPHKNIAKTWKRDWSIYWIATHWEATEAGSEWGKYIAIRDWLASKPGHPELTRQRIHQLVIRVHYLLRDKMVWRDEIIETHP